MCGTWCVYLSVRRPALRTARERHARPALNAALAGAVNTREPRVVKCGRGKHAGIAARAGGGYMGTRTHGYADGRRARLCADGTVHKCSGVGTQRSAIVRARKRSSVLVVVVVVRARVPGAIGTHLGHRDTPRASGHT